MTYLDGARIAAHRGNISRYQRLLGTHLTELERDFVCRRLREEQCALAALTTGQIHRPPPENHPYGSGFPLLTAMVAPET
jgi:hypothetical protein